MVIPMAVIFGLACTFYVYVAIRWWREAMVIRRQGRRSPVIVLLFASASEESAVRQLQVGKKYGPGAGTREIEYGRPGVIVMSRAEIGSLKKSVVA